MYIAYIKVCRVLEYDVGLSRYKDIQLLKTDDIEVAKVMLEKHYKSLNKEFEYYHTFEILSLNKMIE